MMLKLPIGFKVGYERDGYFYSWMGGVLSDYRKKGVAQNLLMNKKVGRSSKTIRM